MKLQCLFLPFGSAPFCFDSIFLCPFQALFSLLLDLLLEDLDVVCQAGDGGLESLVYGLVSYYLFHTAFRVVAKVVE